ncbi:MAG: carboxypeptidase-like regulatory domain-containing protein [Balneolaceae bacterium]
MYPSKIVLLAKNLSTALFITLFFISISGSTIAQVNTIRGEVFASKDNEPLAGVNVYISGTSIGSSTDSNGKFEFETSLKGKFDITASFLGFESQSKIVLLEEGKEYDFTFILEETLLQLNEVQVSAERDKEWQELYADFRRFFIGWDTFSNEVQIENPESIDFERLGRTQVIVSFREPIRIINYSLGYYVTIEQQSIIFNPYDHSGFWNVYSRFEEIDPNPERSTRRKWKSNREKAYKGSSKHFFISLIDENLKNDKFVVLPYSDVIEKVEKEELIRRQFPGQWELIRDNFNVFRVENINFGVAFDPDYKRSGEIASHVELSSFRVNNSLGLIIVDDYGSIFNTKEVVFFGPWSEDRFAKTLPLDYK